LNALRFTVLAALRLVLELFIVKEKLLTRGKNKFIPAISALQNLIDELHCDPLLRRFFDATPPRRQPMRAELFQPLKLLERGPEPERKAAQVRIASNPEIFA